MSLAILWKVNLFVAPLFRLLRKQELTGSCSIIKAYTNKHVMRLLWECSQNEKVVRAVSGFADVRREGRGVICRQLPSSFLLFIASVVKLKVAQGVTRLKLAAHQTKACCTKEAEKTFECNGFPTACMLELLSVLAIALFDWLNGFENQAAGKMQCDLKVPWPPLMNSSRYLHFAPPPTALHDCSVSRGYVLLVKQMNHSLNEGISIIVHHLRFSACAPCSPRNALIAAPAILC